MSDSILNVKLSEVRVPCSSTRIGNIKLMEHQLKVYNSTSNFLVQNVPTSGGKTLAALSNILKQKENAIFIYPTNALLHDQVENLRKSIKGCGYSVKILGEEKSNNTSEISILPVSGELLDKKSIEHGRRISHGRIIRNLMAEAQSSKILMLTNPDILFLIIKGEFSNPLTVLKEFILSRFRTLVLDEFHLYHGYSLANLIFLLSFLKKNIPKLIVSSATIATEENGNGNALQLISELYGEPEIITPSFTCEEGRIIRHETDLTIRGIPSGSPYLFYQEDIEFLLSAVREFYTRHKDSQSNVKVLVILNSVVFTEQVRRKLEEIFGEDKITPIHGLIPKKARLKPSEFSDIVVGTSAIEVGVDFDAASLVFEANTASSFVQRLGRGARHAPCETLALAPIETLRVLREKLKKENGGPIPYEKLVGAVNTCLECMPTYEGFVKSDNSEMLYLAFLYRFINAFIKSGKISEENRIAEIIECIEKKQYQPPFFNPEKLKETFKRFRLMDRGELIKVTSIAGFRDFSMEIPACFPHYDGIIQSISVLDLRKLHFQIQELDEFKQNLDQVLGKLEPQKRREINATLDRFKLEHREKIAIINGIRKEQIKIFAHLQLSNYTSRRPFYIDNRNTTLKCDNVDTNFMSEMQDALMGIPGYHSYSKEDWRMPAIPCANNQGFLIIGASAFVKCYLENELKGRFNV